MKFRSLILPIALFCSLLLSSCAYLINTMIYTNKTQHCALVDYHGDTLCVYSEYGGSFPKACEECMEAAAKHNENAWSFTEEYSCDCSVEKDEEDDYDYDYE